MTTKPADASDTPETNGFGWCLEAFAPIERLERALYFARTLERELTALRHERDALRELLIEARIRIALDGFPHEIVDRIDAALAAQEKP